MINSKKGFTIIEILIAVAIVVILIAIVLAGLDAIRAKGRDARRIADIKQIQGAVESYFDSCYEFPESLEALIPDCKGNVYLTELPDDPDPTKDYGYYSSNSPKSFHLCAQLEFSYGNNKGKAAAAPFAEEDSCDGSSSNPDGNKVFDVTGGAY